MMKGQAGAGLNLPNFYRVIYRQGWLRSLFGLFIAIELYIVFDSLFLALLAVATLVYIPIPEERPRTRNINVWFSCIVMAILLFMAFSNNSLLGLGLEWTWTMPWNWSAQMILFMGFWIIGFLACLSGDIESRQYVGAFLILFSTIIFAIGIGTQEVGTAFFGDWWPMVHNAASPVVDSIGNAFSSIHKTFGNAWMLLTDPVGYSMRLMNGTHASNPYGTSGTLGLEITDFEIPSGVYAEQPLMISAIIDNKGAFDAENVKVGILLGNKKPRNMRISDIIDVKKNCENNNADSDGICYKKGAPEKISKLYKEQIIFTGNVSCNAIDKYDLRKKFIPLKLQVEYDYQSDSKLKIEFISDSEWQRLSREGKIQFKDVASEYSTAPVVFAIGTGGLKQPLNAKNEFHLGIRLDTEEKNSMLTVKKIELQIPSDFQKIGKCTPEGKVEDTKIIWEWNGNNLIPGGKTIYCTFKLANGNINSPTKTYVINAHADYSFIKWSEINTKVKFGSYCCPRTGAIESTLYRESDCPAGQVCCAYTTGGGGYCIPENQYSSEKCGQPGKIDVSYLTNYCRKRLSNNALACHLGMGGCNDDDECLKKINVNGMSGVWQNPNYAHSVDEDLKCKDIDGYNIKACCYGKLNSDQCKAAFEAWLKQATIGSVYLKSPYPYPDEKSIHHAVVP